MKKSFKTAQKVSRLPQDGQRLETANEYSRRPKMGSIWPALGGPPGAREIPRRLPEAPGELSKSPKGAPI